MIILRQRECRVPASPLVRVVAISLAESILGVIGKDFQFSAAQASSRFVVAESVCMDDASYVVLHLMCVSGCGLAV